MSNSKTINGKLISDMILDDIKYQYSKYKENKKCTLVVITIGDDPASKVYVNNKKKACEYVGFDFYNKRFTDYDNYEDICNYIVELNQSPDVYGVIIQLPIISNTLTDIQKKIICKLPAYSKNVDGFGNISKFIPCTPKGIIKIGRAHV